MLVAPVAPGTTIEFELPRPGPIDLVVYGTARVTEGGAPEMLLEPLHQCGIGGLEIGGSSALEPVSRAPDWNE